MRLKKGDKVEVISGKDKGKQGKILAVDRKKKRIVVEGINMLTKHMKPNKSRDHQQGGIVHQEGFIDVSNVMFVHNGKKTRLGVKIENGTKKRIARSTGEVVD